MSDQLISVPLKNTIELDFNEPFTKYFTKIIGVKDKTKINSFCCELNALRSQATKNVEKSPDGLQLISRYSDQISLIATKVPSENLNLQFTWEDALDKGTLFSGRKASATQSSFSFEHLCLLFNVAALQSQLGADESFTDTDDGLKTMSKWFQSAAGIFEHIKTLPSQNLTNDLNPEVLTALSSLMLAQAQEMIVKKAIRDKMKDGILAKLCAQTEAMYSETLEKMSAKFTWDRAWISNVSAKQLLYSGLSQYFQSVVAAAGKRVGEQISRLNLCVEFLKKCQDKQKGINICVQYLAEATRIVTAAKRENDFIYHEIVPDSSSLVPVEKVSSARLAKSTPIPDQLSIGFKDLFAGLESEPKEKEEAPLKAAIDASLHAAGYYMNKLLSGKKPK